MPLATKNNAIILKDGKLAESCGCCDGGACCESNGTCSIKPESQCQGAGQTFRGNGTACLYPNGVPRCSCQSCVYECSGVFLRAAVVTARIVIQPYSALISFPPCPDDSSIINRTYSTQRAEYNYVFSLGGLCFHFSQFSINPESNQISGSSRPVYVPGFLHTLEFSLNSQCGAGLKIYSGAGQSRFVCSENYTMFRNHRHTDDPVFDGGITKYAYDIVRSSEASAQVSCLSDLIGMAVTHRPIPNPDCTTAINGPFGIVYPTDGSYVFCESGGDITAEIISVETTALP